jgi:transcriptional regulator with XRE-family HTH domain
VPRRKIEWFGPRLKALREAKELTQAELGSRVGIVGSQINKLELGVNQPTFATAVALAEALGVECTAFLKEPEAKAEPAPEPKRPPGRPRKAPEAPEGRTGGKPSGKKPRKAR